MLDPLPGVQLDEIDVELLVELLKDFVIRVGIATWHVERRCSTGHVAVDVTRR